ncbi:MAG: hypothetical protein SOW59_08330 [Corynebacterium sp.]|nr:hypothetical protein [Corynebacterium sp.]
MSNQQWTPAPKPDDQWNSWGNGYSEYGSLPGQPVQPQLQQQPQRSGARGSALISVALGVLIAVVLVALGVVFLRLSGFSFDGINLGGSANSSSRSTVFVTEVVRPNAENNGEPAAAAPAPRIDASRYQNFAPDTSVTSQPFAANVYNAFRTEYLKDGKTDQTIKAYSPTTGKSYTMTCRSSGSSVYCNGGNNASVRIW